jgi:hypothetical protein
MIKGEQKNWQRKILIYCMANDTTEAGHYTAIMRGGGGVELMDFINNNLKTSTATGSTLYRVKGMSQNTANLKSSQRNYRGYLLLIATL